MQANIIDGKQAAADLRNEVKQFVEKLKTQNKKLPGLAVILVGSNPASQVYVNAKHKDCEEVGIKSFSYEMSESTSQTELENLIDELNQKDEVHGILLQLPLPKHLDASPLLERISPAKDVDGFHPFNLGRLAQKQPLLRSCTPWGIMKLLQKLPIKLKGMKACVVGASNIVGKPMALELLLANATVTVCNSSTKNLEAEVAGADLVVVGVGKAEMVKGAWIKEGAVVIDVGINRTEAGKLIGDVEFDEAAKKASYITPVPGGVGPMTRAALLENTIQAYKNIEKI